MKGIHRLLQRFSRFRYHRALGRRRKLLLVSLFAHLVWACSVYSAEQTVYLYVYHNKPPFIVDIDRKSGLYYDFARLLNQRTDKYEFITAYVPRKRLDRMIENDDLDGVVLGAHPVWFKDEEQTRFLWLPSIFEDADEFVSLRTTPFEYQDPSSFDGKTLAGVAGYYYFATVDAVKEGRLERVDTIGEQEVLSLIALGRVDMGIVSQSVFRYLRKHGDIEDTFHFSAQKHESFQRRAFTSKHLALLHADLTPLMNEVIEDGSWWRIVDHYQ